MGPISGTTRIKTIFSFSPGTGKHFIGNAFCNSDDSVTQHIHILHFFTTNGVLYKRQEEKNPEELNLENEGTREWVSLFLSNDQETTCPERHDPDGRGEVVHHVTGKLSHRDMTQPGTPRGVAVLVT
jgi:hypothetical protein